MAGFSLITVLFLLVVVTGIGGYLVNLSVTQHLGSALAGQESRAYYAALSGLEWAAYAINNDANDPPNCPAVGTSFAVEGFTVRVADCVRTYPVTEVAGEDYAIYDLTVEALAGSFGDWDFTRRSIRASILE
jgi:MSHA biogenesis protein MshP